MYQKSSLEEVSLKAVLSIGKQEKCLLLGFCSARNLNCDGSRIPFCELERKLIKGEDIFLIRALAKEKVIRLASRIQTQLAIKKKLRPQTPLVAGRENFKCPFFSDLEMPCNLHICSYNSSVIKKTSCLLSNGSGDKIPVAELAIAKNIKKKKLLQLVLGIEAGPKWNRVKDYMDEALRTTRPCKICGHFMASCKHNATLCAQREAVVEILKKEALVPQSFLSYPMTLIVLSTFKEFGDWARHLFPKKALNVYLDSFNERSTYEANCKTNSTKS